MTRTYKDDDIKSLSARDFTRLRPSTYLGSNEYSSQLLREIFANSLDEHTIGHGNNIKVTIDTEKNIYSVEDNGQGFPINVIREDGKTVLEAAFSVINTSGKYDDSKEGAYCGSSLGVNGIGAKLTNYLSRWLEVISWNNCKYENIAFNDGIFNNRKIGSHEDGSGTIISWQPDEQFFQNPNVEITAIKKLFTDISALCPELTITLNVDNNIFTYHSKNGLQDLLDTVVDDRELLNNRFVSKKIFEDGMLDIAMTYTTDYSDTVKPYVNYGLTESGIHVTMLKSLIAKHLNKFAIKNKIIKNEDDSFTASELSEGLVLVFNLKSTAVKYDSQTKTRVVDYNRHIINDAINSEFPVWIESNPKDAKLIIDRAVTARKAKEAAQNARDRIRNAGTKVKKFINLPTKLVDAYSKNRRECELYVCEGDSAANGLIAKRDGKTQAVFPIRGKIISCRKAAADKVYSNQEVSNIVKALGLDIDKETGKLIYDKSKLRYNKIIIASDADSDGFSIRMLLITMFWWLCPELVINGHICIAYPPLYRITVKNKYVYLNSDADLKKYKDTHKKEQYIVNRNKGLGEQDPNELAYCLLRPETRHVETVDVTDVKSADDMIEMFMGPEVEPRRKYLETNIE